MPYVYLTIAVIGEVIATSALKSSEQFTRFWPSVTVVAGYACAFFLNLGWQIERINFSLPALLAGPEVSAAHRGDQMEKMLDMQGDQSRSKRPNSSIGFLNLGIHRRRAGVRLPTG